MLALEVITFGFAWWLGLYLLARDLARPLLRRAGLGLVAYALALAAGLLSARAPIILDTLLDRLHQLLILLPALCWSGALVLLLPEEAALRERLDSAWRYGLIPLAVLAALLAFATDATPMGDQFGAAQVGPAYLALALLALLPLAGGLVLVWRMRWSTGARRPFGLLLAAGMFFGLGTALAVGIPGVPGDPAGRALAGLGLSREFSVLAIGLDLVLLDVAIAWLDAFDQGETLRLDIVRSFAGASFAALLFGSQVALAMRLGAGFGMPMLSLLLATVAAAVAIQTLAGPLQAALDRLAFAGAPGLRRARAELRDTAEALPRLDAGLDLAALEPAEFARLTRRALSLYGDLPRLASSPLTHLPQIAARLAARRAPDDPLERAAELKRLLAESITRLKPHDVGDFGSSDEWRFYNALYFPYIVGLKPYSRRNSRDQLDPPAQAALDWFQRTVPERTLHNWQNAAAKLVAQQLRSDMRGEQVGTSE